MPEYFGSPRMSPQMVERSRLAVRSVMQSPLAMRLFNGAIWSVAGSAVASGLMLLAMMFVARILGKEAYGKFVVVQSTLGMVGAFAGFGIGAAATRYVAELRRSDPHRLANILALTERSVVAFGAIGTIGLAIASDYIAVHVVNSAALAGPLAIAAFSVFFSAVDGYQKSVLIGVEAMRPLALGAVFAAAVSVPLTILAANLYGLEGAAVALVINAMVQAAVSRVQIWRHLTRLGIAANGVGCLREWRILRDFALPSLIATVLVTPVHWVSQMLLVNSADGYAQVAILGVAMQWFNAAMFVPNIAGRIVLPVLTEQMTLGKDNQAAKVLKLTILANVAFALPLALVLAAGSPWLIAAYGQEFQGNGLPLAVIGFVACLAVSAVPLGQFLAAENRMWVGAGLNCGWALVYLLAAWQLTDHGAVGIVLALGVAYVAHSAWVGVIVVRRLRGRISSSSA